MAQWGHSETEVVGVARQWRHERRQYLIVLPVVVIGLVRHVRKVTCVVLSHLFCLSLSVILGCAVLEGFLSRLLRRVVVLSSGLEFPEHLLVDYVLQMYPEPCMRSAFRCVKKTKSLMSQSCTFPQNVNQINLILETGKVNRGMACLSGLPGAWQVIRCFSMRAALSSMTLFSIRIYRIGLVNLLRIPLISSFT
jgi:hypothetical protein